MLRSLDRHASDRQLYPRLGLPATFAESVAIMSACRYVVGIEGGWTHVAAAMNVPYYAVRNDWYRHSIEKIHHFHPTLEIIETYEMPAFIMTDLLRKVFLKGVGFLIVVSSTTKEISTFIVAMSYYCIALFRHDICVSASRALSNVVCSIRPRPSPCV